MSIPFREELISQIPALQLLNCGSDDISILIAIHEIGEEFTPPPPAPIHLLLSIYRFEKLPKFLHRMDSDVPLTFASLVRSWVEPHGEDAPRVGGLNVFLETVADHQRVRGGNIEIAQNMAIKRFAFGQVRILEAIDM